MRNKENSKLWREKNHEIISKKAKIRKFKLKYNITIEQYDEMLNKQNNCCKICGINQNELNKCLVIDHDHITNIVRGLLCDKCNRGLGHFNDNVDLLQNAIKYLKNSL
jgi:Recombination endonuclease VII